MKRKIFSKLLMGAFFIASVSAFVSCKDYDDDINANKAEIKAVQDQLSTLTSNLTSLQSQLQSQKSALEQELATAKSQIETQIADAKAQLNDAIAKKADQATVDALGNRVATLESNLAALTAAYEAKIATIESTLSDLKTTLQSLQANKADISYVDTQIAILNSAIEGKVAKEDFSAFKAEVGNLQNNLENLASLVATKADQKDIDHAVENITKQIQALQEQMKVTVPQTEIANMQKTIDGIQNAINALTQAVTAKAEQSAVDQLNLFYKELKEQVSTLVTPDQLTAALATLKDEITKIGEEETGKLQQAISDLESALNKKLSDLETTVGDNKTEAENKLKEAVEEINKALGTKASIDDLNDAIATLDKAKVNLVDYTTKMAAIDGDIQKANDFIAKVQKDLLADIAKKADKDAFDKLSSEFTTFKGLVDGKISNYDIAIEALNIQTAAISSFLGDLEEGATLASTLAKLKGEMSEEAKGMVDKEVGERKAAIGEVKDLISALTDKLYNEKTGDITKLKEDFAAIDDKIQESIDENLSNLMVFVQRMLTSVTLIPQLYIDGIEAIRFTSIRYIPQVPDYKIVPANYSDAEGYPQTPVTSVGTSPAYLYNFADHQLANKTVGGEEVAPVIIDNGETLAEYRLSPKAVTEDQIDVANIKMWSNTADTETRAASLSENKPVKPEFVSLAKNGNLTVKLRKTELGSIRFAGEGSKGTFVSLSVPRKADEANGIEATDVYSEFSLLDEETIVPRIAALPWVKATDHKASSPMDYHFIDSLHIFSSLTDHNLYVKKEIAFDKPFDLLTLVTGCKGVYNDQTKEVTGHDQISKAELAKYGLAFRFQLPSKYKTFSYNDWTTNYTAQNWNYTDQQAFATLSENNPHNIIQAKLPQDQVILGNRAVIGKEPIVRVMLVDTLNNNLVDQAYFKVKFVDTMPDKPAINIDYTFDAQTINCDYNSMVMRWDKFINLVYAQLKNSEGEVTGMSWDQFRKYYPQTNVYRDNAKFTDNGSYITQGDRENLVRIYWLSNDAATQSPNADANELWWHLYPSYIKTIDKATRQKEFTTTVKFVSSDPKVYGPINLKLKVTIKLPNKPQIVGYNENQWFVSQEKFYVQPVQYGTTNNKDVRPEKVEYDFNITQQFTVTTAKSTSGGSWQNWIVKGIPYSCGSWDVEFATAPNGLKYRSAYKKDNVYTEPNLSSQLTADNLAYKYIDKNAKDALNLWWKGDDNHYSWTNWDSDDADDPSFILHGDQTTADQIIPLLNDLSQKNRADNWTPEKTFDDNKAIDMKVWAKYNDWNYEEITSFKAYLVTPVRINFTAPGAFEDNWVSGTKVDASGKLSITDFVGYAVAKSLNSFSASQRTQERYKYAEKLWNYYGMEDPVFNLGDNDVIYGLKIKDGNLVVDDAVTVDETGGKVINGGMKASQVSAATAGGYTPSLTYEDGYLLYKNKQGREFEKPYNVFVPVTIKHTFGTLKTYVPFPVYPKGKAIADGYKVVEGPTVSARLR